jgi:hypothetical protein
MIIKNRFLFMALALVLSLTMVFGCSDDDDPTDPGDGGDDNPIIEDVGSISGIVSYANGYAMEDATVSAGSQNTTTNEEGYFVLTAVPEGSTLVEFGNDGYMSTFRVADVRSTAATHYPDIVLVAVESGTVDAATGGQVATGDGSGTVDFVADGFVNAAGAAYTGDVTVQLNAMTTDDEDFYGTFPGEFSGVREDGTVVPMVSFGFMAVQLTGENKAPLMLADGTTAELNLTISAEKAVDAPATIPMWYFDETDGLWHEEGEATLAGNTYTADVAHFTTWNWDVPIDDICSITGVVVDDQGLVVNGARVLSRGVDAAIMAEAFTGTDGTFTVNALKNSETDVWAVSGSRASDAVRVAVLEECPVALEEPLVLQVPAYTITLTWGEEPSDLDSHLFIPMTWNEAFDLYRIYYSNPGEMGDNPYASLDTDDTSSFGPEIITGTRFYNGRFQYWVHNYSDDSSAGLQASGASVQLEVSGTLRQYNAADVTLEGADATGWWHVFDMVISAGGETVSVETVMEFQPEYSDGTISEGDKAFSTK